MSHDESYEVTENLFGFLFFFVWNYTYLHTGNVSQPIHVTRIEQTEYTNAGKKASLSQVFVWLFIMLLNMIVHVRDFCSNLYKYK